MSKTQRALHACAVALGYGDEFDYSDDGISKDLWDFCGWMMSTHKDVIFPPDHKPGDLLADNWEDNVTSEMRDEYRASHPLPPGDDFLLRFRLMCRRIPRGDYYRVSRVWNRVDYGYPITADIAGNPEDLWEILLEACPWGFLDPWNKTRQYAINSCNFHYRAKDAPSPAEEAY